MTVIDRGFRKGATDLGIRHVPNGTVEKPKVHTTTTLGYNPAKAVSIFDLKARHCRWPVRDDARGVADLYCGETVAYEGCSYCEAHRQRSKQQTP